MLQASIVVAVVAVAVCLWRVWCILPRRNGATSSSLLHTPGKPSSGNQTSTTSGSTARTLVVLGSGGHTTEMLKLIKRLSMDTYAPLAFVVAASDHTSEEKARVERKDDGPLHFYTIPRSREVHTVHPTMSTSPSHVQFLVGRAVVGVHRVHDSILVSVQCMGGVSLPARRVSLQWPWHMHPHLRSAARPPLSRAPTIVQADLLRVICACAASVAVRSTSVPRRRRFRRALAATAGKIPTCHVSWHDLLDYY
ncbi:hypothetical protein H257_11597 [Aphanomyces astaci]|uniref:UDP-N-acetylglucosamine transferase subunit ALG14 n=1 Tax=Aphanomyces astaci TaxID=112090 RepID=W4G327_APHAT|nr:hypothetical protein H257_11597 [Aphanomyces astaci]ETV73464.1 hypothetical protein H257_11597 [Aphanomyces astaci]|eukprot:XP_009836890.1 hypothetical protein H257_11597 [Aphanomyces astaci]